MADYVAIVEALATRYRANSYPGDSDAETADALDALLCDARRYQWLRQHINIGADGPEEWTCWLTLTCIPFRFDPHEHDAEKLLDALMERWPLEAK